MPEVKRNNHFVPQSYLRQWSKDGRRVWCYRVLVSHERVPEWTLRPIRGTAFQRDLYTTVSGGEETDEFERWLDAEFETPAQEAITKAVNDRPLSSEDWANLARFVAAQDVRTPTSLLDSMRRWNQELPGLLEHSLRRSVRDLEQAHRAGRKLAPKPARTEFFKDILNVKVIRPGDAIGRQSTVKAEVIVGRDLWLESQRFLLSRTAAVLERHKWSIAEPGRLTSWFTSDHPVLRLNYYGEGRYDFNGGWGSRGTDLVMPLSPRHLLFTQVGSEAPDRFTFSGEKTFEIQKFLAERAHRCIFAARPMAKAAWVRPRHVDAAVVRHEQLEWERWHVVQQSPQEPPPQESEPEGVSA